jgi:Xaa-Pro aminopeptidase
VAETDSDIVRQKLEQAAKLLHTHVLDLWLTFDRESSLGKDPALDLIYPHDVTWDSAFLVSSEGVSTAIVGRYDMDNVERLQAFSKVIGYDESIRPTLSEALQPFRDKRIGINTSPNDPAADGLSVGMKSILDEILVEAGIDSEGTVSAERFLASLRGQKTPAEVSRIRAAIETTQNLYQEVSDRIRPGVRERELADFLHDRLRTLGLGYAWDPHNNPVVNTGPDSPIGHTAPSDLVVQEGHLVHFDFGIKQRGFCSDIQRMWYMLGPGEAEPPSEVLRAWDAVRAALLAGAEALKPGARGWEVDQAAREKLVELGYPEYKHAFGHHLGRVAHDGSTLLGPRWDRYGDTPFGAVERDNVFAIELGANVEGRGWVYLEENVLVTDAGLEWLSEPQTELYLIRSR